MAPPRKYPNVDSKERDLLRKEDHRQLEKKRRDRIQTSLELLRQMVPKSKQNQSIKQLQILENAVEYIQFLESRYIPISPALSFVDSEESSKSVPLLFLQNKEKDEVTWHHHKVEYDHLKSEPTKMSITNLLNF